MTYDEACEAAKRIFYECGSSVYVIYSGALRRYEACMGENYMDAHRNGWIEVEALHPAPVHSAA